MYDATVLIACSFLAALIAFVGGVVIGYYEGKKYRVTK